MGFGQEQGVAAVAGVRAPVGGHACDRPAGEGGSFLPARLSAIEAATLGVVEGLTEYLPVSSTGHMILAAHWMGLSGLGAGDGRLLRRIAANPGLSAFEIVIQLGAILAVMGLYRRRVGQMCLGLIGRDRSGLRLVQMLIIGFLPAAVVGVLFEKPVKEHLFNPAAVSIALVAGGIAMIVVERLVQRRCAAPLPSLDDLQLRHALVIGLAQCVALWPGVSRSMITIVAGLIIGMDMLAAAEFSFLLALPTLGGATVYEGIRNWSEITAVAGPAGLLIGLVVSGIVAALAVKVFVKWLTGHGLWPFGVYRIILGLVVLIILGW